MRTLTSLYLTALMALGSACVGGVTDGRPGGGDDNPPPGGGGNPPPPPEEPPPSPAVYARGSLEPIYKLTPRTEYGRFENLGVIMQDADFINNRDAFVSAAQKMDEVGFALAQERGLPSLDLIPFAEDRQRAQQIPFRGNPSDVDIVELDGVTRAVVPLGGDMMTPGNEIAIVTVGQNVSTRVRVGLRPQRVALHPSGLAFVCNQYSNFISIVDIRTGQLLQNADGPVEIATEFYCSDLLLVEKNPLAQDEDEIDLYVANEWRATVLRYGIEVVRDALSDRAIDVRVIDPVNPNPANQPAAEIAGVGANPRRLSLSESQQEIYVANSRGGEISRISIPQQQVVKRVGIGAVAADVVQIGADLFVPSTMHDRGLYDRNEPVIPEQVLADPVSVTGIDGQQHIAHPGAFFDDSRSYNFEDVRNGLFAVDFLLGNTQPVYFTDDVSSEPNYEDRQKVLSGGLSQTAIRNAAGTRIYVAHSGSDEVQELEVVGGGFPLRPTGLEFQTEERPFALAIDEENDQLFVATWGGERLEVFNINNGQRLQSVDLGYAQPAYPATNMETGEYLYYNTEWSNNGRKSCASCHFDELQVDGFGFSNGATTATAYHKVPANWNLLTSDSYFWNGSFANGGYTSLALAAQTRTNCELILFGFIEGPSSNPAQRVGDPNNRVTDGQDEDCRPIIGTPNALPDNFAQIAARIAAQKLVGEQVIEQETGLSRDEVFRFVDYYSVAEMRLPPNPLNYLYENQQLDTATIAKIDQGRQLFTDTGCGNCHDPNNARAPYTDNLNHGAGSAWVQQFVNTYFADPRIVDEIGGIPDRMLEGMSQSVADNEINIHLDPVDFFQPFCFDETSCLSFEDPLVVRGTQAETDRLDLIVTINLADPDRGFVPGNVPGQPSINTPSLRGIWWQQNYLHHGYAYSLQEAILGPGHPSLRDGERGYAIDALGNLDVHGETSALTPDQVDALLLFINTIE